MMYKALILLMVAAVPAITAEVSSSFSLLEKHATFNPDLKSDSVETHAVFKKESKVEPEHPVYRGEHLPQGRAHIEPVRPNGPVIKNDPMLADQPNGSSEVNRVDDLTIPGYGYVPAPAELAYPDVPYAPGYGYENAYASSNSFQYFGTVASTMNTENGYDMYGNGPNSYLMEPDTSTVGLLWSQVPDSRTLVSYVGRTINWVFSSIFVLFLGSLIPVGVCSYTNLCTIAFHGVGPIHEEMRALVSPERLEKISNAADFVKSAIDKYQKIQKVTEATSARKRRAVFY